MKLKPLIKDFLQSPTAKQVASLYSVSMISIPITLVSSIVLTRNMSTVSFGDYKYILSICGLFASLLTFGFYQAASRVLLLTNDEVKSRKVYGASILLTFAFGLIMKLMLLLYTFTSHGSLLKEELLLIIPVCDVFLFGSMIGILLRAEKKIKLITHYKLGIVTIDLLFFILLFYVFKHNSIKLVLIAYLIAQILCVIYVLIRNGFSFKGIKKILSEIWHQEKIYGFHIYTGAVCSIGMQSLTPVLVGLFGQTNAGVGFYSLAMAISSPLALIPVTVATVKYRDFTLSNRINNKLTRVTLLMSLCAMIMIILLAYPFVTFFYGHDYIRVVPLALILSVGSLLYGFGDFFNYYFSAHGDGKLIRNIAIIVGISGLIINLALVPFLDEYGASLARVICGLIYLSVMLWSYKKVK